MPINFIFTKAYWRKMHLLIWNVSITYFVCMSVLDKSAGKKTHNFYNQRISASKRKNLKEKRNWKLCCYWGVWGRGGEASFIDSLMCSNIVTCDWVSFAFYRSTVHSMQAQIKCKVNFTKSSCCLNEMRII